MVKPNGIPLDAAAIVSTSLEGVLYGLSVLMFIGTMWALMYRRMHSSVNRRMIAVACSLLLFSTAHMVIDIIRTYEGLVLHRVEGSIDFFLDISQWSFVYKNIVYMLQTLVGDGVVIYRCYVVWQSWCVVILPVALWLSVAVTGVGCVYFDSQATVNRENIFAPSTGPWITAFLAATLLTNIISTSLLAFRIWKIGTQVTRTASHASVLWPVLRVVLDAGVLYSVSLLAALLCFVAKNLGHFVLLDMIMPIISITFYMVIVRITVSHSISRGISRPSSTGSGPIMFSRVSHLGGEHESRYEMKRMEVHITQLTETSKREYAGSGEPTKGERKTEAGGKLEGEGDGTNDVPSGFAV